MPNIPMTFVEKLHLLGTALTFLGGVGLSYDLLTGFPKRNEAEIKTHQLEVLKKFQVNMESTYKGLRTPPYTDPEKQALIEELKKSFPTAPLENEINQLTKGHAQQSFIWGWIGIIAVLAGFLIDLGLALAPLFR